MLIRMNQGPQILRAPEDDRGADDLDEDLSLDPPDDDEDDDQHDDLQDDDADEDDLDGLDEGDEDGEDEPPQRQPSRSENRVAKATRDAKEAKERSDRLEREMADLRASIRPQTSQPQETPEQRRDRLALMEPVERMEYLLNESRQETQRTLQRMEFENADRADQLAYEGLCQKAPVAAKLKDEVEKRLADMRKAGTTAPRETRYRSLYRRQDPAAGPAPAGGLPVRRPADPPQGRGTTYTATRYNRLPLPYAPLSEGVPPIGETMSIQQVTATALQWGDKVTITDVGRADHQAPAVQEGPEAGHGLQIGETLERNTFNALMAGTQVNYVNSRGSRGALVAGDVLDTNTVIRTDAALETLGAPRFMGDEETDTKIEAESGRSRPARTRAACRTTWRSCHTLVVGRLPPERRRPAGLVLFGPEPPLQLRGRRVVGHPLLQDQHGARASPVSPSNRAPLRRRHRRQRSRPATTMSSSPRRTRRTSTRAASIRCRTRSR
jgi:hypothetical protein